MFASITVGSEDSIEFCIFVYIQHVCPVGSVILIIILFLSKPSFNERNTVLFEFSNITETDISLTYTLNGNTVESELFTLFLDGDLSSPNWLSASHFDHSVILSICWHNSSITTDSAANVNSCVISKSFQFLSRLCSWNCDDVHFVDQLFLWCSGCCRQVVLEPCVPVITLSL